MSLPVIVTPDAGITLASKKILKGALRRPQPPLLKGIGIDTSDEGWTWHAPPAFHAGLHYGTTLRVQRCAPHRGLSARDRKSTRLNSSHRH